MTESIGKLFRHSAAAACIACCSAGASGADWRPVPGAPDVRVDVTSIQLQRGAVNAWLRFAGSAPLLQRHIALLGVKLTGVRRSEILAQFDCERRTVRTLAAQAYGGAAVPVYMSTVETGAQALPEDEELAWAYDALCEAARTRADAR